MRRKSSPWPVLTFSVLIACLLTVIRVPEWAEPLMPFWLGLVMLYWALELPEYAGIGTAWLAGLLLDLVTGSLLGQHALQLTIMIYIALRFRRRIRLFLPWQQALTVLALLINNRIVTLWIRGVLGVPWPDYSFWLSPLVGTMVWPFVVITLDGLRRRFKTA